MKVGQWIRIDNLITKINLIEILEETWANEKETWINDKYEFNEQTLPKARSRPQELIQVGDLVKERHGYIGEVATKHEAFINTDSETIFLNHIVIIYTQDNNGNYIKQWEKQ